MEAKVIVDHKICSSKGAGRKKLPVRPLPDVKSHKPYVKPQIILELDIETIPACWMHPPPVVTSEDLIR